MRARMGAIVSFPYFVCAARMSACLWEGSKTGASGGGSERRLDISLET